MDNFIYWDVFPEELTAFTTTREIGNVSLTNDYDGLALFNREKLAKESKIPLDNFVACQQTHSTNFRKLTASDRGLGIRNKNNAIQDSDGLYTECSNVALMSFHADCTPILLYDPKRKIVAAIHSGWKGTVDCILQKMVTHLINSENCNPSNIYAYIGPAISKDAFEVKDDVYNLVVQMPFDTSSYCKKINNDTYLVDCKGLNKEQLLQCGVPLRNITVSPYCTYLHNDLFFSHRKGESHRCVSAIMLK